MSDIVVKLVHHVADFLVFCPPVAREASARPMIDVEASLFAVLAF